jgi:hypothetical protein
VIGLLVGAIVVGRDTIHAAQIRQTIAQKEKFDAAANAFKLKFNELPGDMYDASTMGLNTPSLCGNCNGNGDGIIGTQNGTTQNQEFAYFWLHLYNANLIQMQEMGTLLWGAQTPAGYMSPTCPICNQANFTAGATVLAGGWYVQQLQNYTALNCYSTTWTSQGGQIPAWNAFELVGAYGIWVNTKNYAFALTAYDAYAIDAKIDDGQPLTGSVLAWSSGTASNAVCPGTSSFPALIVPSCVSAGQYVLSNTAYCTNLIIKAGF